MPDGDRVGSAHVDIHVNAAPGEAELAAFKAKVDRDFAELDRKKAEASLTLKSVDFDKKIADKKAELDYFEGRKATATAALATKHFEAEIARVKAELKALGKEKTTVQIDTRQVREAHKQERLLAKEHSLTERAAIQSAKAEKSLANERDKAVTRTFKERSELAKLGAEYEKLRGRQLGLEKSSRRVFSSKSIATAEKEARSLERVASEADYVKHKIERLGGSVNDLDPDIQRNHTLWGRWLSRLGDTSIRIGPITTSFKGLGTGLALLGPLVFELGGGLTALAGTVGEGLAGAFTVGAGAMAGFALSAAGVGFIIGPMVGEFKEVSAASTALYKAQLKYGKGSEEAKGYQEKLNQELKGVSPIAKEAFVSLGSLKGRWKELTADARPAVFEGMGQAIKTAQALLPAFASESVKTTKVASQAWQGWMKSLRSSEAQGLLKSIMGDFRASIPGLADGLGSLVAMMGRLSAAGAHFLPGLSNGFAEWADNLEDAVGGGQKLQSNVGGMVNQMRDLGHLTQDTGSLLVHIFDAGADSGQGMVKSLDAVIKRWDTWTQSTSGKAGLQEFFGDSKGATEDFMSSLSHLTKLLFEFSRATAPVANGLLQIVTWIGDLVSAADKIAGVKEIFQALGGVLAGLWVTGKVMAFGDSIALVASRMGLLTVANEAAAVSEAEVAAGATAAAVAMEAEALSAVEVEAAMAASAGASTKAALGLGGVEAGAAGAGIGLGAIVGGAAIAGVGLYALATAIEGTKESFKDANAEFAKTAAGLQGPTHQIAATTNAYTDTLRRNTSATHAVAEARKRLVKLDKENAPIKQLDKATKELNDAERARTHTSHEIAHVQGQSIKQNHELLSGARERVHAGTRLVAKAKDEYQTMSLLYRGTTLQHKAKENLALAERKLAQAHDEVATAARKEFFLSLPLERHLKNLAPISAQAQRALQQLSKTLGEATARRINKIVDPKDVERVASLSNRLQRLGRGSQVKQIDVKSRGADQTISKLQRLQHQTSRVEATRATIKVGANDTQAQKKLQRLGALSQKVTGARNTIRILANSSSAEQAINRLRNHLQSVAHQKYQATMSAIDKTAPGWQAAYHHLREIASKKYEARINAIDNASSVAKKAGSAADAAGRKKPKIQITATADQALAEVRRTEAAINAISSNVHPAAVIVPVTFRATNSPPTKFAGGPAAYMAPFAIGGPSDQALQRAADKAVIAPGGASRKISKPTMLTGEEAPQHPEYVIATNPAYRESNERYLEDAAGDLGYKVIPAYGKGKGKKKKQKGHAGGGAGGGPSGKKPPKGLHKPHYYIRHDTFEPRGVNEINTEEKHLQELEHEYDAEMQREENNIAAKRQTEYNFAWFTSKLEAEQGINANINHVLVPRVVRAAKKEKDRADWSLSHELSSKTLKNAQQEATHAANASSGAKQQKGESDKEFRKRKKGLKETATQKANRLRQIKTERKNAQKISNEAAAEIAELRHQQRETVIANEEIGVEIQEMEDFRTGAIDAPYETGEPSGTEKPTLGEQTATANLSREQLFNQFASNILGFGGAAAGTHTPGSGVVPYGAGSAAAQLAATTGPGGYVTAAAAGGLRPGGGTNTLSGGGGKPGTVNNVTNNFASPPPDPHTWTRGQQFELGALAA